MPGLLIGGRGRVGGSDAQRRAEQWQSSGKPGQDQRCLHQAGAGRVASGSREAQAPRRTRRRHVCLAQDWLSSRAGPALGGRGRKAGSGDGPAGRPAAFGWLALQGGPGARAPRALILCLSGFRARRCFWHFKEREAGVGRADEQQLVGGGGGCGCEATWDGRREVREPREGRGRGRRKRTRPGPHAPVGRPPGLPFVICLVGA